MRIFASVRAGEGVLFWIESFLENLSLATLGTVVIFPRQLWVVRLTFSLKVFLPIRYLRPSDEGVSLERGRQVAIQKEFSPSTTNNQNFASILIWRQSCSDSVNREPTE